MKVKRFSEIYFTAKFLSFCLKKRFRMAGGDKNFQPPFFAFFPSGVKNSLQK
jgi:hypothetical protein